MIPKQEVRSSTPIGSRRSGRLQDSTSRCEHREPRTNLELARRDGYRVVRRAGRYAVFPRSVSSEILRADRRDGLVEIWNGMPFFSPLWAKGPRVVFLHHVHAEMWQMALPPRLAALEFRGTDRRSSALPRYADRHAVGVLPTRDRVDAQDGSRPCHGGAARGRRAVLTGREVVQQCLWLWPSAASSR